MPAQIAYGAIAFGLAFSVTAANLITSRFPTTACLAVRCRYLWVYSFIYGLLAVAAFLVYPLLTGHVTAADVTASATSGLSLSNPWQRAIFVGLTIKTLMHLRLFEISTGPGQSFPIGIETIVQPFEPLLLRELDLEHWAVASTLLHTACRAYPDPVTTQALAVAAIPGSFTAADRAALAADLTSTARIQDVLRVFLFAVGCRVFKQTFP